MLNNSPWLELLTKLISQVGMFRAKIVVFIILLLGSLAVSCVYYYVALGTIPWLNVIGMLVFSASVSPIIIYLVFDLLHQLQASTDFLENATKQEKLLNQSLKSNIKRLNSEIDERKLAFEAKRRAIDELRREIAERKRTQQELQEQGTLLRSIIDSSPDLFYYRDNSGRFAGCNKMFEQVLGLSGESLIGKRAEEIYPDELLPSVLETDLEVQKNHVSLTLDVSYANKGTERWFEMRKVPFFNDNNEYIGLLGFGRDITSRKQAEQDLEKAYKDKGKFIATLSHELRTPLNGIVGLTRRLLDTDLNKEQRSWCNTVFSSAETLGNIFNDIIDMDKVDRDQLDVACENVHLQPFFDDVVNFAGLIAEQKSLDFDVSLSGDLNIHAELDPTRLRQVLWNLINNAVKFTKAGTVSLSIERISNDFNNHLLISVKDTGIGIAKEELSRIFDLYYKVPDVQGGNALGSGIGLAVSRALVLAMDGDIKVSSEPNVGSEFSIYLPLKLVEVAPKTTFEHIKPLNILLVEDVPLNAEIATNLLEQRGHDVIWAETGEDALALVETEDDLDLVLLDMQLPDINGDEVARVIREELCLDELPIVALTANVRRAEEDLAGVKVQGALAKPLSTKMLDELLHTLFPKHVTQTQVTTENKQAGEKPNVHFNKTEYATTLCFDTIDDFVESMGVTSFERGAELFTTLYPKYVDELTIALNSGDKAEYKSVAHKLKGAAGSVGLKALQKHAKCMEDNAESAALADLENWLQQLPKMAEDGLKVLKTYLAKLY